MEYSNLLVNIFFRLLNFSIILALGIYLFKKYVYPTALEEIAEKESFIRGLSQQNSVLQERAHVLDNHISYQQQFCAQMRDKLLRWQEKVHMQEQAKLQQRKRYQEIKEEYIAQRHKRLQAQALYKVAMHQALAKARTMLDEEYKGAVGNQIIEKIITHLSGESYD
jgi:hypothetical protein